MGDVYRKSKGNAGLDGVQFQLDLLTVSLLNALQSHKDWKISSENQAAGKYDDLVLEMPDKSIFMQSKFKRTKKITRDQLLSTNSKNLDFSLPKYFFSYLEIKSQVKEKTVIVCTNTEINEKGLENVFTRHLAGPDSMLHCGSATCWYVTATKSILPDLKENAMIYLDRNLQGKGIDKSLITDENLLDFLENFKFFSGYPSRDDLHKIIEQLLSSFSCKFSYHDIYRQIEEWFKQPKGEYLTPFRAKAMLCEIRSDKYCESLKSYNVSFEHNTLIFTGPERIIHVNSEGGYLLQMLKISHALQSSRGRTLYVGPEDGVEVQKQVVEAFELRRYSFLVMAWTTIDDEAVRTEISGKLREILEKDQYKKVILVGESYTDWIGLNDISQVEGLVAFEDLSRDCQERLLRNKNIVFQDKKINLEQLLQTEICNGTRSLDSATLEVLIRGEEVKVGVQTSDLDEDTAGYYVSRIFQPNVDPKSKKRIIVSEKDFYNVDEKVIIISDSAGMGKSTVLTKMAAIIKENNNDLWVVKINLNDYTRVLRDFLKQDKESIKIVEVLNSREVTKITNRLEEFVFSMEKKVVLMLDGVDEISPDYTDLIFSLLGQCLDDTYLAKIFVTTRPHVAGELEAVLKVASFRMLPFTKPDQIEFLTNYWSHNLHLNCRNKEKCKQYAETLIEKISSWMKSFHQLNNSFAEVPLQVRMLAEIFQENVSSKESLHWEGCKQYLEGDGAQPKLPEKFNIARLYQTFIEKKRDVFMDKGNPSGRAMANPALLKQFETCLAFHRNLALKVILGEIDLFLNCYASDRDTEEFVLKVGIVQKLGGQFRFIHRTFAEYFVAESIVEELKRQNPSTEFQRLVIDEILLSNGFEVICSFLDVFLQTVSLPPDAFKNYRSLSCKPNLHLIYKLAWENYVQILRIILESINFKAITGKQVDIGDWKGKTILQKTNTLNDLKFLTKTAGVNIRNGLGDTPLHYAVRRGHLDMISFLIDQGASVNLPNNHGRAVLYEACQMNTLDSIKYLTEYEVSVTGYAKPDGAVIPETVKIDVLRYLLEHGADVDSRDSEGRGALHEVVETEQLELMKFLLGNGADINVTDKYRRTPLHLAAKKNLFHTVKYLVENDANVNAGDDENRTPLHLAAQRNHLVIVRYLLENGADIYAKDTDGRTPLHLAAIRGVPHTVTYLLRCIIDVNVRDSTGHSPLHYAALGHVFGAAKYLAEHQDASGSEECVVTYFPAKWEKLLTVKCLVEHCVDVNARNDDGRTPLHLAALTGALDIVAYLEECGADLSVRDNDDRTVHHLAVDGVRWRNVEYFEEVTRC